MTKNIKSLAIEASAFIVAFGLIVLFIYFVFLRDWIIDEEKKDAAISALNLYMENPSDTNFSNAFSAYTECLTRLRFGDCEHSHHSDLVSVMILNSHIDQIINDFDMRASFGLEGDINTKLMVNYLGDGVVGLFMKADALVRNNQVHLAIPIYRSLFERNRHDEVAVRLRGLLSYYGCTSDYEVWGEHTERQTTDVHPYGAPYPKQASSLSTPELVDLRIRLSRGEFVPFTSDCPINKLLP